MNSDITASNPNQECNHLSLEGSRELLSEVRHATQGTLQHELSTFSTLVCQVLDLHEQSDVDPLVRCETASFIAKSIEEIRTLMNTDASTSDQMQSLQADALRRWGDRLRTEDEFDFQQTLHNAEEWDCGDYDETENEIDIVAAQCRRDRIADASSR